MAKYLKRLKILLILLVVVLLLNTRFTSAEDSKFVMEDGVVTGVVDLEEGGSLCFPDTVTAVDLTLDFEKLNEIKSETSLEYCNLTLRNCRVNNVSVTSENTTLVVKGGSIASLSLTGEEETSIASVSCSGITTIPVVKMNANDSIFSSDAQQMNVMHFGDDVEYVRLIGKETSIQGLRFGSEVCDFLASGIQEITTIQNDSDYLSVIDECVYSYLEYEDYDCSGSSTLHPELVLCFYPRKKSEESGEIKVYSGCDMIGEEVFAGHVFQRDTAIVPEGIRIVGEGAFANLPKETTIELPKSLEYIDQDVFNGSTAFIQFDTKTRVICNPYAFRGLTTRELLIPDFLSFYYYNKSDDELKSLIEFSVEGVDKVRVADSAKSAVFFQTEKSVVCLGRVFGVSAKRSKTGKVTVVWKGVAGAEKYVVCSASSIDFSKSQKRKVTKRLSVVLKNSKAKFVRVRAKKGERKGKWSKTVKVL